MTIKLVLDGTPVEARTGQTILDVAREHGIRIPTLCYHKDLTQTGNCRMCVVEVPNSRFLQAACTRKMGEIEMAKIPFKSLTI